MHIKRFSEMFESLDDNKGIPKDFLKKVKDEDVRKPDSRKAMETSMQGMNLHVNIKLIENDLPKKDLYEIANNIVRSAFENDSVLQNVGINLDHIKFDLEILDKIPFPGPTQMLPPELRNIFTNYNPQTYPIKKNSSLNPKSDENTLKQKKENDKEFSAEIDKRNLINALTQGFALDSRKHFLEAEEKGAVDKLPEGLMQQYFNFLKAAQDSHKYIPLDIQKDAIKMVPPEGMSEIIYPENDTDPIVIKAIGTNLIILVQEMFKGIYELMSHHGLSGIEADKLSKIYAETETLGSEFEGFLYGPKMAHIFDNFYDKLENELIKEGFILQHYPALKPSLLAYIYNPQNVNSEVFLDLFARIINAADNDEIRPFNEFKKFYKDVFNQSKVEEQQPESDNTNEPEDDELASGQDDYWNKSNATNTTDEQPVDYSKLSQTQLQRILDTALDSNDMETVKKVSPYLKESFKG